MSGSTSDTFQKLNTWVNHAYEVTNKALIDILFTKFKFEGHCNSIRKYLLMGQGDFMAYLMDLLAEELGEQASKIYRHTLMGYLETAIRSSNAQYHGTEFLNRLDIKLLEASPGDRGWEIFQLDYRLSDVAALSTIFSEEVMVVFQKINNFLWKLKRVEHQLSQSWGLGVSYFNQFNKIQGMKNKFHRFYLAHQEMAHFVTNIHNYIMVEVLESSWKIYQDDIQTVKNLDDLIEVQKRYSKSILHKALLSDEQKDLNRLLKKLLNNSYTFALIKERYFYKSALEEVDRLNMDENDQNEAANDENVASQINHQSIEQLDKTHAEFYTNFKQFKDMLEVREETNFKYLRCRLDFNMYYQLKQMQEVGALDNDEDNMDDQEMNSQYGEEDQNQMEYGSIDDDGMGGGNDDDDEDEG